MTTIATDGKSMAGDGMLCDHCETIVNLGGRKVHRLDDGRIIGASGNSFDIIAWRDWLKSGREGACPIESDQFAGLVLHPNGVVHWVDHKGREIVTPAPCAIGSGQDYAIGAMEAGASAEQAVTIACRRDPHSGGDITALHLSPALEAVA